MVKITVELNDESQNKLLEIQFKRKKSKREPTAINKIASEILTKALEDYKEKNPD